MKAIEYYNKYYPRFVMPSPDQNSSNLAELMSNFHEEIRQLKEKRHISKYDSIISLLKEFDQKWKCIVRLFNEDGHEYLRNDWFEALIEVIYNIQIN